MLTKGIVTMTLSANTALEMDEAKDALHAAVDYLDQMIEDIREMPRRDTQRL